MLNYLRYGTGPTLVTQHGFMGGGGYFAPLMAALGHAFDIIAPDLPGFAGSGNEPVARSIEALSQAQVALLDELEIDRFCLLGHSMGGMASLQTALDHPNRVEKLVLYGTNSSGDLPGRFETFGETAKKLNDNGLDSMVRDVTSSWFIHGDDDPMFQFCHEAGRGARVEAVKTCLEFLEHWSVDDRLHELEVPVLIICGDRDRSIGLDGLIKMHKRIAGSELCILPNSAHCAHLEQGTLFNSAVQNFLFRTGGS
jgi:pimeloyl-ACP methyl ester carboxylesterase